MYELKAKKEVKKTQGITAIDPRYLLLENPALKFSDRFPDVLNIRVVATIPN